MIFKGVCTALVTPFTNKKRVDFKALNKLIDYQINNGIKALLILGTTGENCTINCDEREKIIKFVVSKVKNKCKVIVGTGSNDTHKAIYFTNQAQKLGADACLIVTPYYNKCTQNGVYYHYKNISQNTNLPFFVYNVPSRTGFNMEVSTIKKISTLKNFQGIKEASGDINHILKLFNVLDNKKIYCGNDNLSHIFKCYQANGLISVTSNAYPKQVIMGWKTYKNSLNYNKKFYKCNEMIFCEPNPIPIKYILCRKNFISNSLRMPLTPLQGKNKKILNYILDEME